MRRATLCVLVAWACLAAPASAEFSSLPRAGAMAVDGPVTAVASAGGVTYVGGAFGTVGPKTGGGLLYDAGLTRRDASIPTVAGGAGIVYVTIPDGGGGWYVGGDFTQVGNLARMNVAHIKADNTVDPAFNAGAFDIGQAGSARARVTRLVLSGSTLYVGGAFIKIGATTIRGIAAMDAATGALTAFDSGWTSTNPPSGMVVLRGRMYISGFFSNLGTTNGLQGFAELNATDGKVTSWRPGPTNGRDITSIYGSPDGSTLYVACPYCTFAPSAARNGVAAFSIPADASASPTLLPFDVEVYGNYTNPVLTMTQIGNTLYTMGRVAYVIVVDGTGRHSVARTGGAAFDVSGAGTLLGWDPKADNAITSSTTLAGKLLVAGDFQKFNGASARRVAVLDPTSAAPVAGGLDITGGVNTVAADATRVYVGGAIVTSDGLRRTNLVAFNADGSVAPFAGSVSGTVRALAVAGGKLYVGGDFGNATGQADTAPTGRRHLASFDVADGSLTAFNPDIEGGVSTLAADAANLYVGGPLSKIKNVAHGGLAAFALGNDTPLTFDPAPDGSVNALALTGSRLYAGGSFTKLGGIAGTPARSDVAAFSLPALDLDLGFVPPAFDRQVNALAASDTGVFAGGAFSTVGGTARPRLAKLAPSTGALAAWDAQVNDTVFSLDRVGSTLYAGGAFGLVGGKVRDHAAGIDTESGVPTEFNPGPDRSVTAIVHDATQLILAGSFQNVAGVPQNFLAAFPAPGSGIATVTPVGGSSPSGGGGAAATPTATATGSAAGSTLAGSPGTTITSGPDAFTTAAVASFTFSSDTAAATFGCSLDGAAFAPCASPFTSPALAPGAHTFTVRAIAPGGTVDVGGASQAWTVLAPDGADGLSAAAAAPGLRVTAKKRFRVGKGKGGFKLMLASAAYIEIVLQRAKGKGWRDAARLPTSYRKAGASTVKFNGTVAGAPLRRGRYRAQVTATGAGGLTEAKTVAFKLVLKPAKPRKTHTKRRNPHTKHRTKQP